MASNPSFFSLHPTFSVLIFIHLFAFPLVHGISVDLIHRDNPKSPYHNASTSHFERLNNAFRRSFLRASHFQKRIIGSKLPADSSSQPIQSLIFPAAGEYLMQASIGSPPFDILAIADTGSDLTWTQCQPCDQCYAQDAPLFDPSKSNTYRKVSCDSDYCQLGAGQSGCDESNNCQYWYTYGDGSYTHGDVSTETFTFQSGAGGGNVSIPRVVFGCGHENFGTFNSSSSGIIGLGGGALSIVKQLHRSVQGKFSYCLVPIFVDSNVSSTISFGSNAGVSGPGTVSTPLFRKSPDTFYFLNLEGISIRDRNSTKKVSFPSGTNQTSRDAGNIIIDSGTTLTFLPQQLYNDLEASLKDFIKGTRVSDPQGLFGLCYRLEKGLNFPDLVVHFTGADILLPPTSTFLQVSEGMICLTFVPSDQFSIFGNLSQMNFLIGYDLVNLKVSFQPKDCTKHK